MVGIAYVAPSLGIPWSLSFWKFNLSDVRCESSCDRALLGLPRGIVEEGDQSYMKIIGSGIHYLEFVSSEYFIYLF